MRRKYVYPALNWLIKGTIAAFLLFTIYKQAFGAERAAGLWRAWLQQPGQGQWWWLAAVLLLLPANWALEAEKWRCLMRPFWRPTFGQAFRAVMMGVSFSLFTPSRIGEYPGRVLVVPAPYRSRALLAMAAGSYAQLLFIMGMGGVGSLYFIAFLPEGLQRMAGMGAGLVLAFAFVLAAGFFHLGQLPVIALRFRAPKRMLRMLLLLRQYSRRRLALALGLAFARYAVYSLQYCGLLAFFGLGIPPAAALAGCAAVFLVQSSIPLPPPLALLLRGEAALVIWAPFSHFSLGILGASFGLFIINLCLPALLGLIFIVKTNVLKSLGYENDVVQNEPVKCSADLSHGFYSPGKAGMG